MRELYAEQRNVWKENRALLKALADEGGREMTAEEKAAYDKRDERITRIDELTQQMADSEARGAALDQLEDDPVRPDPGEKRDDATDPDEEMRMNIFRKMLVPERFRNEKHRLTEAERRAVMQTDDFVGGGSMVAPQQFIGELIVGINDANFVRALSRTFDLDMAVSLGAPSVDTKFSDSDWQGEVASITRDTSLVTGKRELTPHNSVKLVRVSRNLARNSAVPIDGFLRGEFTRLFGNTEEKGFLTGSGAQQPLGVFTASASGISTSRDVTSSSGSATIHQNDPIDVLYNLKEGYMNRATYILHRDWVKAIRKLVATTNQYLWGPGLIGGQPATILDRPYRMSEFAPNTASAGQYAIICGDFSYYWIATALTMEIQVLVEKYADTNEFGYIGRMEVDGMPVLEEAFSRLVLD